MSDDEPKGALARVVSVFLHGPLALLLAVAALAAGLVAVVATPREEEPQIVVPVADVYVQAPGASADEVERLVATPLERLLWQVDGVEHVYSVSRRGMAIVTVRFFVGEDREASLVKLHDRILSHTDEVPPIVRGWVVKPVEIDDVPIVTITLASDELDDHALRRIGEEVLARLDSLPDISRSMVIGGRPSEVRVQPDPERLAARGLSALDLERALAGANAAVVAGSFDRMDRARRVTTGPLLCDADDVAQLVVGVHEGRPVRLVDVADVSLGPAEANAHVRLGLGPADPHAPRGGVRDAVTLAISKKRGTNAVAVAENVIERFEELRREIVPAAVDYRITRNYGRSADAKVDELLANLAFAVLTVVGLLLFSLGWREGLIVALAVPVSFALALFVNLLFGYTINRVTLFALILTLGLVVDDPITNVDNIQRHILRGRRMPRGATLCAVQEVLPPVIMSTLTIIVSFVPMFFITGMMGPYMEPMAVTVPLTVGFSTVAALSVVPWACHKLLHSRSPLVCGVPPPTSAAEPRGPLARLYARVVGPFLARRWMRWGLFLGVLALLAGSGLLVVRGSVPLKMLPYDDKDELLLLIDLPEGATLERTDAVVRDIEHYLDRVPEVTDFESYVGIPGPVDFNGLVRHYYQRRAPHLAEVRLNLLHKDERSAQSHEIALRIRDDLERIAAEDGALLSIVELPPGPPVLSTIVAEVHGPVGVANETLRAAASQVAERMRAERGVVDVDVMVEAQRPRLDFVLDQEKAALHGVNQDGVAHALKMALTGLTPALVHAPGERQPLEVRLRLPRAARSGAPELGRLPMRASDGSLVPLGELGRFEEVPEDLSIYHKNLKPIVWVIAETAGRPPAEAIFALQEHLEEHPLPGATYVEWASEGEWEITIRVFRDLGLAFGAALLGIYLLLIIQTESFLMPLLIMSAIPLTAIGILPGFWLLNAIVDHPIGGYATPVFFTATAMIGMIALGGIVVRNSIVLIEFIEGALAQGRPLREAILESGAVRMRPILLTAATTAFGAWPITLDPIFSGLAWALIFGLFASTAFTLVVVPVTYYAFLRAAPGIGGLIPAAAPHGGPQRQ